MTMETPVRTCPKCGARLSTERLDHQLSGQERLFCPQHGEVGSLQEMRARRHRDEEAETDDFE